MASPSQQDSAGTRTDAYEYPITPHDVFQVRQLFMKLKLPMELILQILDISNYRPIIRVARDETVTLSSNHGVKSEATALYLTSPAVPLGNKDVNITHRLKYIKFSISSSDQGWGGDEGCPGTYNGSYTWFEASILRPSREQTTGTPVNQGPLELEFSRQPPPKLRIPNDAGRQLREQGWNMVQDPANGEAKTWHIQSNLTASSERREHEVLWERGKLLQTTDEITGENNGKGSGEGFLDAFQEGDRIAIWARAQFPGWTNHVYAASVEIAYDEHDEK